MLFTSSNWGISALELNVNSVVWRDSVTEWLYEWKKVEFLIVSLSCNCFCYECKCQFFTSDLIQRLDEMVLSVVCAMIRQTVLIQIKNSNPWNILILIKYFFRLQRVERTLCCDWFAFPNSDLLLVEMPTRVDDLYSHLRIRQFALSYQSVRK